MLMNDIFVLRSAPDKNTCLNAAQTFFVKYEALVEIPMMNNLRQI